jgi:hypothetical protein
VCKPKEPRRGVSRSGHTLVHQQRKQSQLRHQQHKEADGEGKIQTIKSIVRAYDSSLPSVIPRILLVLCVLFCVSRINTRPSHLYIDKTSPLEQFSGRKLDTKVDLRFSFGDYSMKPRTEGCIAGVSTASVPLESSPATSSAFKQQRKATREESIPLEMMVQ